jgi:cytochrome c553
MNGTMRITLILALIAFVACSLQVADGPATDAQELTPPSELALLMRRMAAHADSVKAGLARGDKSLPPYPKEIAKLLTATPTKDMHIDPITFPTFGKDYQAKVAALYKAKPQQRAQAYNAVVQACANCHGSHCPGPLMRIRKMYVKAD